MQRAILATVFCLAAWPCGASVIEDTPAQWSWPPFVSLSIMPARSALPLPPVLVSAAQYGAGLVDVQPELISNVDQGGFEAAYISGGGSAPRRVVSAGRPPVPMQDVCDALVASAHRHNLPVPFFIRLIWQESGFNPHAVSPVGAQGMAQFMPATATQMGLNDPFDPIPALQASARLLRALIGQFGNVGLAAAAYNAGPKRIVDWLQKRVTLPEETRHYVMNITGHAADSWRNTKPGTLGLTVPKRAPCQAGTEFASVLEVPAPLPPPLPKRKPGAATRVLAKVRAKDQMPVARKTREQVIINVAANHAGSTARPNITVIAAHTPLRLPSKTQLAKARKTPKNGRVQIAMGLHR